MSCLGQVQSCFWRSMKRLLLTILCYSQCFLIYTPPVKSVNPLGPACILMVSAILSIQIYKLISKCHLWANSTIKNIYIYFPILVAFLESSGEEMLPTQIMKHTFEVLGFLSGNLNRVKTSNQILLRQLQKSRTNLQV